VLLGRNDGRHAVMDCPTSRRSPDGAKRNSELGGPALAGLRKSNSPSGEGAELRSRRFQSRHLGVELEPQLLGFLLGQPAGHVRKDRPIKQGLVRIPRKLFRRAGFGQNLVQPGADLVRIGPIGRRGHVGFEQFGLRVSLEQVLLG
jgi:hypothetical protein